MSEALGGMLGLIFVIGGVVVLLAIVRFSIISPMLARNARGRLHKPDLPEFEAKWNVKLPAALEALYASELMDSAEVYLGPLGANAKQSWHFYKFFPLTVRDLSEQLKIARVPGLPIASDGDKGIFYLPFAQLKDKTTVPVLLRTPNEKGDVGMAASVEEFLKFERKEPPKE
jgi:hypothetical protein